jgi:hypothetical protein
LSDDDARRAQEAYDVAVRSAEETMAAAMETIGAAMRSAWEAHGGVGNYDEEWLEFGISPEGKTFAAAMDLIQEAFDAALGSAQEAFIAAIRAAQEARDAGGGSIA